MPADSRSKARPSPSQSPPPTTAPPPPSWRYGPGNRAHRRQRGRHRTAARSPTRSPAASPRTATALGAQPGEYTLENLAAAPASITAGAVNGQSATVGERFPIPLAVTVTDNNGNPVAGASSPSLPRRAGRAELPVPRAQEEHCAHEPHRPRPDEQQRHRGRAAVHRQRVGGRLRRHGHRQRQLRANGLLALNLPRG